MWSDECGVMSDEKLRILGVKNENLTIKKKQSKESILVIVSRFPYPLDKGDKLRAYHQIRELSQHFDVTIVALTDKRISPNQKKAVEGICEKLIVCHLTLFSKAWNMFLRFLKKEPLQVGYFYSSRAKRTINQLIKHNEFAHIYCQLIRTAEYAKDVHHIPKTIDYMDALSTGIQRQIKLQAFYKRWIYKLESERLVKYEQSIFDYFENKTIISEQDKQLIHHPEKEKIICVPNGIDGSFFEQITFHKEFDFVFVGNMSYPPNVEAVHFIAEEIMPAYTNSTLLISGASPSSSVRSLAESNPNITLTGWVDDIRTSYAKGKIFLAPMMIGTGMQNKLLEAMALEVSCVTTSLANNAIKATHKKEIMVGENAKELIACIRTLQEDADFSKKLGAEGSAFVKQHYSWKKSTGKLIELIDRR